MKRCPFCGDEPQSNDWQVWCYGNSPDNPHGLIQMRAEAWEVRATLEGPGIQELQRGQVAVVIDTLPAADAPKPRRTSKAAVQRAQAEEFGKEAAQLSKLMDFGHGGDL